ncbi:MAG: glucose-1-phosphate thymidylyltransferase [Chloroflexi bacterium]|nr:glucose-1-phosphate thymidylyltransferase [Chloroflexota bacterium]
MKALILAAGKGSRLYPATKKTPKPLMPIAGRETLCYVIDEIIENEITEIGIVVSEENIGEISIFTKRYYPEFKISIILQQEQLGVAHAVKISKNFIKDDNFLLYLGDNLFENGISKVVSKFKLNENNIISIKSVPDPRKFGVAEINKNGNLNKIVEKPENPQSSLAVTGIYGFNNKIFDCIEKISLSKRGEYEITDAIKISLEVDDIVDTQIIDGWWVDTGNITDYLKANEYKLISNNNPQDLEKINSQGTKIDSFSYISNNSEILESQIINYTSIGSNVNISNSVIENCVILDESEIKNYRLKNCILSKGTSLINTSPNRKIIENKII